MKAAAYVRVSTEDQARNGYSLEEQELQCRQYASELGANECRVFRDEGISGGLLERPGLTALREAVKAGAFSYVICKDPDRLSRELVHQLIVTEEIEKQAQLRFVNFERDSATPEGNLFFQMRGVISQFEKAKITQRMADGRKQKARDGGLPVYAEAYGYRHERGKSDLVIVESEAAVVRRIFGMFVQEGKGPQAIARILTEENVPTKRGAGHWYRGVIRKMLLNPMYRGVFYYGKKDYHGVYLNKHRPAGQKTPIKEAPKKDWLAIDVPAIVDDVTWYKATSLLEDATRLWRGYHVHDYLLSGLIRCGKCGRTMVGTRGGDTNRRHYYYTCHRGTYGLTDTDCKHYARAEDVEELVWQKVSALLKGETDIITTPDNHSQELGMVEEQLAEQLAARKRLVNALEKGLVDEDDLTESLGQIKKRIVYLQARKTQLAENLGETAAWQEQVDHIRATVAKQDLTQVLFEEKQHMLRSVIREIVLYPTGEISLSFRAPLHCEMESATRNSTIPPAARSSTVT